MTSTLIGGVLTGLTYALLSVGLVLVYRTGHFVNLAHAQLGVVGALVVARTAGDLGWGYAFAAAVGVASGVLLGLLAEVLAVRRIRIRSDLSFLLLTLGLAQLLLAATHLDWLQPDPARLGRDGYPLPFDVRWDVGGFVLRGQHVLVLAAAPTLGTALAAFLSWTSAGRAIRAVASDPEEARLCGISPDRVRASVWMIAGGMSAVTAILVAPSQGTFNLPALGPDLLLRALGGAAIGGFRSLRLAAVGGVVLGLAEHAALRLSGRGSVAELAVLAVVFTAVVVGLPRTEALDAREHAVVPSFDDTRIPDRLAQHHVVRHRGPYGVALALIAATLVPLTPPLRDESDRFLLTLLVVFALASVSLTVLLGWSGQLSLGHFALVGVGGYLTARLDPLGWSMPVVLACAAAVGAAVMVLLGLPTLRLPAVALPVITLGFATVGAKHLYDQPWFAATDLATARPPGLAGVGRPSSMLGVYYVSLAVLAVALVGLSAFRRATPGRLVVATRDNERDVMSLGFSPARVKLSVHALSGAIATASGVLWISAWRTISSDLITPESSLVLLAAPVVGGLGSLAGAVAGSVYVYAPEMFFGSALRDVFGRSIGMTLLISGAGLVAVQLWLPGGMAVGVRRAAARLTRRLAAPEHGARADG